MTGFAFPKDFFFGAAAASYQIEGAHDADGKGESVWDAFCRRPGKIEQGDTGDVACDHHHRYEGDIALMQEIGLHAYRLSISWPRLLPEGVGRVNEAGLAFYDRLIDSLLNAGIEPHVTLFHWDYPLSLYHRGGWLSRESPNWFAEYSELVAKRFGDRVKHWLTLNEPQVFIDAGHREGRHAPGDRLAFGDVLRAGHHTLMAHGRAVQVLRAFAPGARIGFAPVTLASVPESDSEADREAARRHTFETREPILRTNAWWMDAAMLGHYPEDALRLFGDQLPKIASNDFDIICQPLDFFGTNIYSATVVRAGESGSPEVVPFPPGNPRSAFDWPITPEALYYGPLFLHQRYKLPIMITENGISCRDSLSLDGKVHDFARIDFIERHLRELARASTDGVPVLGYFHWSILDNFEWAHGYKHRFGLIHVDYQTQERTLKDSARFYQGIIAGT